MKREITISKNGNKSSLKWGYVGEKNATHLIIELPDKLVNCDYCQAEFSSKGIKVLTDRLEIIDGKVTAVIPFESTACAGKLSVQIVGYVVDEDDEIFAIGKSAVFSGQIFASVTGKITNEKADIPLLHRIWAKIEAWASKIHEHENNKILDGFHCKAYENPFYIGMDANDLTWTGGALRFRGDGAVIRETKEIERDGQKYLRLYLHWSNGVSMDWQSDFIDIPVTGITKVEEEKPGFDFTLNGGALELPTGGNGAEKESCIPVVHELPTEAADGDMCLYSPANIIEPSDSGKRIYFDWEEFIKPIDDDATTDVYYVFEEVPDGIYGIAILRVNEGESTFVIRQPLSTFQIKWVNEVFVGGCYDRFTAEGDIEYTIEYTSVDELPKYYELEKFDTILEQIVEGNVPCFYAPYRLMVYRAGEWQRVETLLDIEGGTADLTDYYTKQEIDNKGFITKADIPTDESYELIGETPLTLTEKSNIKLESAVETTYEAKTPTVWNFDDVFASGDYTLTKCTLEREDDHYKFVSGDTITAHHQSHMKVFIPVEAGKTYTLSWDNSASKKEPQASATDWGGLVSVYDGEDTSKIIKTNVRLDDFKSIVATPTTNILQIRYHPPSVHSSAPKPNVIGRFNAMWLNEGDTTALTEIYNISGAFNGSVTLQKVPKGATVTATPTANVYRKSPTDKTLTESDVPADAKETGERIEAFKNLLPLYGKTIVNFGDSIFGNAQPPVDISTHLANKTGATVYNCGFGGCRMTPHSSTDYNAFSMCNLAPAISSGDFTQQNDAVASGNLAERYTTGLERLKSIDFSNVDIVTIAYGSNDFNGNGAPLDNEENLYDITAFGGALRYSIETLLNTYPNLKIFILSIAWRFWTNDNNEYVDDTNTHTNNNGALTKDYNAKLKEIAEEYNLPFVDDYNIGIGKFNRLQYFNANDGAHHKEEGRRLIAEHLATALSMGNNIPDSSIDKVTLSASSAKLNANKLYDFGVATELTITFANNDPTKYNEYSFTFTSGATPTVLTLPSSVQWANELTVETNKRYEISIVDNIGLWCAVDLVVSE